MSAGLTIEDLLSCYRRGVFPMAERRDADELYLVDPEWRGVIPIAGFHVPRRLARTIRADGFDVTVNQAFAETLDGCASPAPGREETWINPAIRGLYLDLHHLGHAHSVECRRAGAIVGGLYGVAVGGAFFGESMFSTERDASKVALAHLVARLKHGGFALLDAQFWTPHLAQFGALEMPRRSFKRALAAALSAPARFPLEPARWTGDQVLQVIAQTS